MIRLFALVMKEIKPDTNLDECVDSIQIRSTHEGEDLSEEKKIPVVEVEVNLFEIQQFLHDYLDIAAFDYMLKQVVKAGFRLAREIQIRQGKE